ncbi:MAG: sensor histidine kinase [Eisenbergiella sp.]
MNKTIWKIVLINFVVVTIICCMWFFGIFGVIVYSVILFVTLRKYFSRLREQYKTLLEATNQLAEGNLDIEINEDLGLFNPFKGECRRSVGLQKAVDEEVKSQNMKTELITNVSHDLKTPLTAIITYVDLLKDENITPEERQSYINTLDKKSQRLKVLIEDLFEVSKATTKNVTLNIIEVDIVNLLKQVKFDLEEKIQSSTRTATLPEEK